MKSYLDVAKQAAKKAGDYILHSSTNITALTIEQKSLHDYVSEVDLESERIIAKIIQQHYPDHAFLGEEGEYKEHSVVEGADHSFQWVVDPLDGTTNFLRSIPHYAVSIALLIDNQIEVAVIFDPSKNDLFWAERGKGAFLNGMSISVSSSKGLNGALLATGIPYSGKQLQNISQFTQCMTALLHKNTSGIRRLGAAALDLAYVACGRYDGFWEADLKIWDIAAGILLVTEAGGMVSDLLGADTVMQTGNIIAANRAVHNDMLSVTAMFYNNHLPTTTS